jgi:hypothetical protein
MVVDVLRDGSSSGRRMARPGRRAVVADDLAELHGPTSGIVELPHQLFWQLRRLDRLDDSVFVDLYGRTTAEVAEIRSRFADWPRQ